jgi:hypothetical protein
MANPLGDDAANLIKEAQEYLVTGAVYWDSHLKTHLIPVGKGICSVADLASVLRGDRELLIEKIVKHILDEVGQVEFGGGHGSRSTYVKGCRGLLCRRAHREELRRAQGQQPSARFQVPDELLDEAEARIPPDSVVGQVRFADRIARVG